jgi:hypothetical protein
MDVFGKHDNAMPFTIDVTTELAIRAVVGSDRRIPLDEINCSHELFSIH